jgi:vacuolar-type H+-ATPase subunit E/Vma4
MSLADIVRKIEHDAASEAREIVAAAEADAQGVRDDATRRADDLRERAVAQARINAEDDARMRVAAARLAGRDRLLAEKRVMVDRALSTAVERLETLPDGEYAALLAREAAKSARGDEVVALGELDAERLRTHLPAALADVGCTATLGESTSEIARGVLLEGDRMRVEVSVAALLEADRERYETTVAEILFGEGEA